MARRRHVPVRTCVSCGMKTAKRDLLRIAASSADGRVRVDETGRLDGRGAYLCGACRQSTETLRRGRLEHALRTKIGDEDWGTLTKSARRTDEPDAGGAEDAEPSSQE